MQRPINRVAPVGPVQAYKTYQVSSPFSTHWRKATCEEVDCPNYLRGWKTILPVGSDLLDVVRKSGRPFTEERDAAVVTFTFGPGLQCFDVSKHQVQFRPERYLVRDGDHRGNPTGRVREHTRPADWVEDFALHADKIAQEIKKG